VHVEGLDDVMVRLSRCCTPVPGDEIIGFVTRGRGVSVHRADCANAASLQDGQHDRLIEVEWDEDYAGGAFASASQRQVNMTWELTQAAIALSVIWGAVGAAIWMVVSDSTNRLMAFLFLSNVVSIVIGFYFGRTNHQRVGGVDLGR